MSAPDCDAHGRQPQRRPRRRPRSPQPDERARQPARDAPDAHRRPAPRRRAAPVEGGAPRSREAGSPKAQREGRRPRTAVPPKATAAKSRPRRRSAAKPQTAAMPASRRRACRVRSAPQPAGRPHGTELVTTAVQATGELAQIGLTVGGQAAQARRRPHPAPVARSRQVADRCRSARVASFPPRRIAAGPAAANGGPMRRGAAGANRPCHGRSAAFSARARQLTP